MRVKAKYALFFILPAFILIAVFVAYPVARTVVLSFLDSGGRFVGLKIMLGYFRAER